jgi:hypothetical protein
VQGYKYSKVFSENLYIPSTNNCHLVNAGFERFYLITFPRDSRDHLYAFIHRLNEIKNFCYG